MHLEREELLKQKAIIEAHLNWLNEKLSQFPTAEDNWTAKETSVAQPAEAVTLSSSSQLSEHLNSPAANNPAAYRMETEHADIDPNQFVSSPNNTGITTQQKVGCVIAAVAVCLLFIGGLFGSYIWELLF